MDIRARERRLPPTRPHLPRVVVALAGDFVLGCALGALFLAVCAAIEPHGLLAMILELPVGVAAGVLAGGVMPFGLGFAATGLDYRASDDSA